ncbi:MAG: hypothetical protein AMDU1_APLC00093G0009 [Thermoplasmatales archaeon A-plasma]|jgi:molybdopterin/thiamine biosynthesis adenylyltransferase|nr:MAG: hypothetical protein AMDU1_APLC00093G0009 [Thermoplasmatales archaeon A-plasma]
MMLNFGLKYSREISLQEIGPEGFARLRSASVTVVGLGATGSPAADLMVRAGVGSIKLVDGDTVDVTNLHRQILYAQSDTGKNKAETAARVLSSFNSDVAVSAVPENLNAGNAREIIEGSTVVIDGTDNLATRRIIDRVCYDLRIPWVFVASVGTMSQVKAIVPDVTSCLHCFIPDAQGDGASCETMGVLASAPLMAASLGWTMAVKIITGKNVTGDLFFLDPWNTEFQSVKIARNPLCPVCGGH